MFVPRLALVLVLAAGVTARAQDAGEWFAKAVYTTNPDEQIHYYTKVLEADPNHHQAQHNLAGVYYRKGYVRKSIALYESQIRQGRAYHQTFYNLACCYARVGDNEHSVKALKRALEKGFKDRKLIQRDADLVEVRRMPAYHALAARYLGGAKPRISPALPEELDVAEAPVKKKSKKTTLAKVAKKGAKGKEPRAIEQPEATAELGAAELP